MATENAKINTRIQLKHDTKENWEKAINFIPKPGEVIIYDIDENNTNARFKVGDGSTTVNNLPFTDLNTATKTELEELASNVAYINAEDNETIVDSSSLEKIDIQLNESAPIETISSICNFTLIPTTMPVAYGLRKPVAYNGTFKEREIPLLTTKGTLSVKDKNGAVRYSKDIKPIINKRGVSDLLTEKGIYKAWSEKFYLNKSPVSAIPDEYTNYTWTWEFTEDEFQQTGLPAKLVDIPIASACFYNGDNSQAYIEKRVYYAQPYPAKFSYDAINNKYILIARGVYENIETQLSNAKAYFYYQLDTPYNIVDNFAMGISAEDIVTFEADFADTQDIIDSGEVYGTEQNGATDNIEFNIDPTVEIFVPRNSNDAFDGMINAARIFNNAENSIEDEPTQSYNWIGEGDGTTDYTSIIQNKLNLLHSLTDGGVVYLGPGTYPISGNLNVYENTTIIGCGPKTIIKQTADNTSVIILSGSNITLKDFTINLAGACTELTACVYANSENDTGENGYPQNYYVANLTMDNILMTGKYRFDYVNGAGVISEAYNNYKGVGIYGKSYFNYAHIDNVHGRYLMCVIYGSGGGNYFNITSEFCKYGVYDGGSNNIFFINGHSYYEKNESGEYISMSDGVVHDIGGHQNIYNISVYDTQHLSYLIYFGGQTQSNTYTINTNCATSDHSNKINTDRTGTKLEYKILDLGRGNISTNYYKNIPFSIGNVSRQISGQTTQIISDHVILNALSGAGVWGNITSNVTFTDRSEDGLNLSDICRYPSERTGSEAYFNTPSTISTVGASEDAPIEIEIDIRNRPLYGQLGYFIQFDHRYVASDFTVYYDIYNNGQYDISWDVKNNVDVISYLIQHQNAPYNIYRIKFSFTKPLQIENFTYENSGYVATTINYNPEGLIGICNIGMTVNDYAGRSFLGECGGSLYGNVDMHQNTLKNLPMPQEDGDAVSKAYLEERLNALLAQINGN